MSIVSTCLQTAIHKLSWSRARKIRCLSFLSGAPGHGCARAATCFPAECVRFLDLVVNQGDFERGKRIMAAFLAFDARAGTGWQIYSVD